jgi:hypothetical protein
MTTVGSIYVGRFDQNLAAKRIFPPPQPNSQLLQVQQVAMCPVRAVFSPWEPVAACYDFLLYSMTHSARKNTENRQEDPKLWPWECLNKGSVYAHV